MPEQEFLIYKNVKGSYKYRNKNLAQIIDVIAIKYGKTTICTIGGKEYKRPNSKQAKLLICDKCLEYFDVKVSLKQISHLLRPHSGKFPYTAIVIIETIYNLLKEDCDRWTSNWREECWDYLRKTSLGTTCYEKYLLGQLAEGISSKIDEFMNSCYAELFVCFIDSRAIYQDVFGDTSISTCLESFPVQSLTRMHIPQSMYVYQSERIYFKE